MLARVIFSLLLLVASGQQTTGNNQSQPAISVATSTFSQNLYQQLKDGDDSLVYSPYSIHSALTMSFYGARGETADEMVQTLALTSLSGSAPHQAYHDIIEGISKVADVELESANAIFVNPNIGVEPDYVREVTSDYFSLATNFDLAAPEGPEKAINDYVANKTEDMVQDILKPGTIDGNTVMVLINSIFFNGTWAEPFDATKTQSRHGFMDLSGTKSTVDMMSDARTVRMKQDNMNEVDVVELPFRNPRFALYIALPQRPYGISDLESTLTQPGQVDGLFADLQYTKVELKVPKFKIETSVKLNDALINLGMVKAFDEMDADFTGISPQGIYISQVLHKAVIEVQESGTVAAAATAVVFPFRSFQIPPQTSFVADHPFLFFLRDNETQEILFQGRFAHGLLE